MKLQRRKGFSLVEIVIAMSLVVMISAAGFFSCVVAIKISSRSEAEAKIYNDVEKFRLCLSSAHESMESVSGDKNNFISSLMGDLEFYFEADGLSDMVKDMTGSVTIPIRYKDGESTGEVVYSLSVGYEETTGYLITVKDAVHYTECSINIVGDAVNSAHIRGYRTNSNSVIYEKEISFARGEV